MRRIDIENCKDIEILRKLCIEQHNQLAYVGNVLVDESKWHINSDLAVQLIREHLVRNQNKLDFDGEE